MRAVRLHHYDERPTVEDVPEPQILNPRDAIIRGTSTAICGSDLHLYDGYIPTMEKGDILGHEFMGEIVELVFNKVGDYMIGNLLISVVAGIVSYVALTLLDVPFRIPLAIMVAFLDLVPMVGATLGAVIVAAALAGDGAG